MLWKCCTQYVSKLGKLSSGHRTGNGFPIILGIRMKNAVFILIPKNVNAKECSNYCTIALISHTSKVMLKILQARLQQYMNCEFPHVRAGFRKGRGTRDQIVNIHWIIEKAREFQKNIYFCFIRQSLWLCGTQQTVENFSKDGNTRLPYLPPEKPVCRSRSNS